MAGGNDVIVGGGKEVLRQMRERCSLGKSKER